MSHLSNDSLLAILHQPSTGQLHKNTYTQPPMLNQIIIWKEYSKTYICSYKKVQDSFLIHITIYSQLSLEMWHSAYIFK